MQNLVILVSDIGLSPDSVDPLQYLIQSWLIDNWTLRNKLQWILNQNTNIFFHKNMLEWQPFCLGINVLVLYMYFNSLGPSDAIWQQRSESPLAQVMACCLMAPSHYLNQYCLSSVKSGDIHLRASQQEIPQPLITEIIWKIKYLKCHSNFPEANELKDKKFAIMVIKCYHSPSLLSPWVTS